eukprot:Amastigsp_a1719_104.p5 type:complete len:132 gc:universal Amastigsp_a1719_104:481-86(-)
MHSFAEPTENQRKGQIELAEHVLCTIGFLRRSCVPEQTSPHGAAMNSSDEGSCGLGIKPRARAIKFALFRRMKFAARARPRHGHGKPVPNAPARFFPKALFARSLLREPTFGPAAGIMKKSACGEPRQNAS